MSNNLANITQIKKIEVNWKESRGEKNSREFSRAGTGCGWWLWLNVWMSVTNKNKNQICYNICRKYHIGIIKTNAILNSKNSNLFERGWNGWKTHGYAPELQPRCTNRSYANSSVTLSSSSCNLLNVEVLKFWRKLIEFHLNLFNLLYEEKWNLRFVIKL